MLFSLFQNQRKKILAQPFPEQWERYLLTNFWQYRYLTDANKESVRNITKVLVAEKNWEGCKGLAVTEEIQVTIASIAALLVIELPHNNYYANTESILVYPYDYVATEVHAGPGRTISEVPTIRAGETSYTGPVVLSWPDVITAGRHQGFPNNVVLHEFAHKLDWNNGAVDGVPGLATKAECDRWEKVMSVEYQRHCEATANGTGTLINPYGATSPPEFFAVVTECFFQQPQNLQLHHPDLYSLFRNYYGHDPAQWVSVYNI